MMGCMKESYIPKGEKLIIRVERLKMHFPIKKGVFKRTIGRVYAVDGISFQIRKGESLGLIGESGCGKSTVGRCILRLYKPTQGKIFFDGIEISNLKRSQLAKYRKQIQMIFQDPYSSLNPRLRVKDIIGEALKVHHIVKPDKISDRVSELMEVVGLNGSVLPDAWRLIRN
jgi:ABC-type oligopeptide transport system ATPase subunit